MVWLLWRDRAAVRADAQLPASAFSDAMVDKLFRCIDADHSNNIEVRVSLQQARQIGSVLPALDFLSTRAGRLQSPSGLLWTDIGGGVRGVVG